MKPSFRLFFFNVLFFLLVEYCVLTNYTFFTLHNQAGCLDSSYLCTWGFELPSECTHRPFWDTVIYDYYEPNNTIRYATYHSDEIFHPQCEEDKIKEILFFPLHTCVSVEKYGRKWWMNFTISESLPFDMNETQAHIVFENFQQHDCKDPYTLDKNFADKHSTNITVRTGEEYQGIHFRYYHSYYCTQDWFAIAYYFPWSHRLDGYKFFRDTKSGECVSQFNNTLWEDIRSVIFRCWDPGEYDEYVHSLPQKSEGEYMIQSSFFDPQCTRNHTFMQYALDKCNDIYIRQTVANHLWVEFFHSEWDCEDAAVISVEVQYYSSLSTCLTNSYTDPFGLTWYHSFDFYTDVYFPNQAAIVMSPSCDDEISASDVSRSQSDMFIIYITDDFCFNRKRINHNPEMGFESCRAKCVDGKMWSKNYTQTDFCDGYYEIIDESFCIDTEGYGAYHFLCLPYYCSNFSQFDTENVCSGHGECIGIDTCVCDDGYIGKFCEALGPGPDDGNNEGVGYISNGGVTTAIWISLGVSGGTIFLLFDAVVILGLVLICCCLLSSLATCICLCMVGWISLVTLYERRRLWKFLQLGDDFYMLVEEHNIEKSSEMNRFRIKKEMLVVQYEDIKLERILGEGGGNATVYLCRYKGSEYAFKRFRARRVYSNESSFEEFEREVQIISSINHPNILRFFGIALKPPTVGILLEYCENGDILSYIRRKTVEHEFNMTPRDDDDDINEKPKLKINEGKSGISMWEKTRWMDEIAAGMQFLHSKGVIHRDLKPNNVLLDTNLVAKVMDFGVSKISEDDQDFSKTKGVGTSKYMAPEICKSPDYDEKVDVFSFGIMIFEISTETFKPYGEEKYIEFKVSNNPYYRPNVKDMNVDRWLKMLCSRCWKHDSTRRPSFTEIQGFIREKRKLYDPQKKRLNEEEILVELGNQGNVLRQIDDEDDDEINIDDRKILHSNQVIVVYLRRMFQCNSESEDFLLMNKSIQFLVDLIAKIERIDRGKVDPIKMYRVKIFQGGDGEEGFKEHHQELKTDEDVRRYVKNDDIIAYQLEKFKVVFDDEEEEGEGEEERLKDVV